MRTNVRSGRRGCPRGQRVGALLSNLLTAGMRNILRPLWRPSRAKAGPDAGGGIPPGAHRAARPASALLGDRCSSDAEELSVRATRRRMLRRFDPAVWPHLRMPSSHPDRATAIHPPDSPALPGALARATLHEHAHGAFRASGGRDERHPSDRVGRYMEQRRTAATSKGGSAMVNALLYVCKLVVHYPRRRIRHRRPESNHSGGP